MGIEMGNTASQQLRSRVKRTACNTLAAALLLGGVSGCYGFDPSDIPVPSIPNPPGNGESGPAVSFQYEVFEVDQGVLSEVTSGCENVPSSASDGAFGFGFGRAPSEGEIAYSVEYGFFANHVTASVTNNDSGERALEVEYDEEFLLSGVEDESTAELSPDLSVILIGRGLPGCPPASAPF